LSGDVIVTVTLNAALHVAYATGKAADDITPISRPGYRAGGRGVTVARVLHSFGHDVLAAGLAGGASGELIIQDLARSGVPTAFTLIRGESRRFFRFADPENDGPALRFAEPGPFITTEELGRFAAEHHLVEHDINRLASWWHTDSDLGRDVESFADMSKSREAGFLAARSTESSFAEKLTKYRSAGVIP